MLSDSSSMPRHGVGTGIVELLRQLQEERRDGRLCHNSSNTPTNHGGARQLPIAYDTSESLRVHHLIIPSDPMYVHHLWMYARCGVRTDTTLPPKSLVWLC